MTTLTGDTPLFVILPEQEFAHKHHVFELPHRRCGLREFMEASLYFFAAACLLG
jgi:hypothetical protein